MRVQSTSRARATAGPSTLSMSWANNLPVKQGLYDPENEKDSCGVGFICHIKGVQRHAIVRDAKGILCNMTHRGAVGTRY